MKKSPTFTALWKSGSDWKTRLTEINALVADNQRFWPSSILFSFSFFPYDGIFHSLSNISLKILSFPRLTEKNRSEKQTVCFFGGRKTDRLFFAFGLFFRGPKNRVTVFRTVFHRKTGKTVKYFQGQKWCQTSFLFFFGSIRNVLTGMWIRVED